MSKVKRQNLNIRLPLLALRGLVVFPNTLITVDVARDRSLAAVRAATKLPLITKLSPNVTRIADFAVAARDAGSDMLSLVNTFTGLSIDIERRRSRIANFTGGYSGPGIKPIAVRMVHEVHRAVPEVPLVGMGGIRCAEDAIEFIMAGATAVGVGTAIFADPRCLVEIPRRMAAWMDAHGVATLAEITGIV